MSSIQKTEMATLAGAAADAVAPPLRAAAGAAPSVVRDLAVIAGWFCGLSAAYWLGVMLVSGRVGFSLDDAFIHLQFARNFFESGEMAFNAGVPSSGCTAPAFPMLTAAAYALTRNWFAASFLLCGLASLGTGWVVYAMLRSWTGRADIARWGGVLVIVASPTIAQAYSGMEAPVYSLVFLLALWCYGRRSRASRCGASAIFATLVWLRPEFLAVLPLIVIERLIWHRGAGRGRLGRAFTECIPIVLVWVPIVAGYVLYHWFQDGHLYPTTFDAKVMVHHIKPRWLDAVPVALSDRNWLQLPLAIAVWPVVNVAVIGLGLATVCMPLACGLKKAAGALWRERGERAHGWRLAMILLLGFPLLRAWVDPVGTIWGQQQRYFAHLTPLMVLIVLGSVSLTGAVLRRKRWNWRKVSLAVQRRRTIGWALGNTLLMGTVAVISVGNINDMQVDLAHWLRDHTSEGDLIATNDIGAIGFFTRRPILDTIGLVEPPIVEHLQAGGTVEGYLQKRDPAYVVIFPNWYEALSQRDDLLERVHSVKLDFNVVCGGSEFVVYKPKWTAAVAP